MLKNSRILIVEDEPIISMALAYAVEDAGGQVLGPAASIKMAMTLLSTEEVAAAIMDVNLPDGIISPVVEYLMERKVPIILLTGVGIPEELAARFPSLIVLIKPTRSHVIISELAALIQNS